LVKLILRMAESRWSSASGNYNGWPENPDAKNQEAKEYMKNGNMGEAIRCITEAINLDPTAAKYYGNRAQLYFKRKDYKRSLNDCFEALKLNERYNKAYIRQHQCHVAEGDFGAALIALKQCQKLGHENAKVDEMVAEVENLKAKEDKLNSLMKQGNLDFTAASDLIDKLSRSAPACKRFQLLKIECAAYEGKIQDAENILSEMDPNNPEVIYLQGLVLYFQDKIDEALTLMKSALVKLPDLPKAQKYIRIMRAISKHTEEGKTSFKKKDYAGTVTHYTKALEIPELGNLTKARLLANRAVANSQLKDYRAVIDDSSQAIKYNSKYEKAYFQRAIGYKNMKNYEEALFDFEKVLKLNENKEALKEFDEIAEIVEKTLVEPYDILHVSPNATKTEIRKAFLVQSKKYHPDHHAGTSRKVWFNQRYNKIQEAQKLLSEPAVQE